jgi:NDP-sugar pyrophosphorylase family protein
LGTRLNLPDVPKPMVDINGQPFLRLLVEWAAGQGLRRFIFCSGHKASVIRDHFKPEAGREYLFSEEKEPLGTGGALKLCEPLLKSRPVVIMNGDTYCDLDLAAMLETHAKRKAAASVSLADAGERRDGGFVSIENDGRIKSFAEKDPAGGTWLNAGVLALGEEIFAAIPKKKACSLEREVLPKFLNKGLYGFTTPAPLYDIGTPERLKTFRKIFKA